MKNLEIMKQNLKSFKVEDFGFRTGQLPFYTTMSDAILKGIISLYVKGPTGIGKTFLEAVIAAALMGRSSNVKILLLTSKVKLLNQIQAEFHKFTPHIQTGIVGGGKKEFGRPLTIMTYDSYRSLLEDDLKMYDVVVLDESHKGLGPKTKVQLELQKIYSLLIGLTASDYYSERKNLEDFLVHKAYELSVVESVHLGLLCNIKFMAPCVDIFVSERQKGETTHQYEDRLSAEIIREGGNIAAARFYKRVFAKGKHRGMALVLNTKQGIDLVKEFKKEGLKAKLIHSKLSDDEQDKIFKGFKNNKFQILVGMGMIKEGFNDTTVSVSMTVYPVQSAVDIVQFPGRAARIDLDFEDKVAYIVNFNFGVSQRFYSSVLDGLVEVHQIRKRKRHLRVISDEAIRSAIRGSNSVITDVVLTEGEVVEVMKSQNDLSWFYKLPREEQIEILKQELAKHGIVDRVSLMNIGIREFINLDFGSFGKATVFSSLTLGQRVSNIKTITLEEIAEKLGWTDKVKTLENAILELKKHGIVDRISLVSLGPTKFMKLDFGVFGRSLAFTRFILGQNMKHVTSQALEEVAKKLGWTDKVKTLENAILELKKHGIVDRISLLSLGPRKFTKLDFGLFGKGRSFAGFVLDRKLEFVTTPILEEIAEKLGWTDKVKTLENAILELKKHGIVDRVSLLLVGPEKFMKLDFGSFGKGATFVRIILDRKFEFATISALEEVAKKLGWTDKVKTLENAILELKKHGIVDRVSLVSLGPTKFMKLDFGVFGRSLAFTGFILGQNMKHVASQALEEVAKKLGWTDKVKTLENAILELKKHGIVDRVSLMSLSPIKFTKLDFGVFGKGFGLAMFVLDQKIMSLTNSILEKIAEKLGWTDKVKTLDNAILELKKHEIVDRVSLLGVGSSKFRKINFGVFKKSGSFAGFILNRKVDYVTKQVLEEIADCLGW